MSSRASTRAPTSSSSTPAASSTARRRNRSTRSAQALAENGKVIVTGCMGAEPEKITGKYPERARGHRPAAIRERGRGRAPRGAAAARSVRRPGAAGRHQAHAAALRVSEDFRGLQQPLHLLHHPEAARRSRLAAGRRRAARGRAAGRGRREGTAGHLAGHLGLRRRHQVRREPMEGPRGAREVPRSRRASSASSAPGCGCTTSTPTRTSTTSSR